jgi:hypothetical protein
MNTILAPAIQSRISKAVTLFDEKPPILVEVRFPKAGTSPDWYLCQELTDFEALVQRLGDSGELHLHSVWDLTAKGKSIVL